MKTQMSSDILALYLNCRVHIEGLEDGQYAILTQVGSHNEISIFDKEDNCHGDILQSVNSEDIVPILRSLDDMTDEEEKWFEDYCEKAATPIPSFTQMAEVTKWLLSKQFDLFGLIDEGLAIREQPEKSHDERKHHVPDFEITQRGKVTKYFKCKKCDFNEVHDTKKSATEAHKFYIGQT